MIVFCDTNVHVAVLRGALTPARLAELAPGTLRLSPVVASELLRGSRGKARRAVEKLVAQLIPIEPGAWRPAWLAAGRTLAEVFEKHESIGLARLQNDCLLALTARDAGALFVTADQHFAALRRAIPFALKLLPTSSP
jgi:predicted nucleic acid-binding protein